MKRDQNFCFLTPSKSIQAGISLWLLQCNKVKKENMKGRTFGELLKMKTFHVELCG